MTISQPSARRNPKAALRQRAARHRGGPGATCAAPKVRRAPRRGSRDPRPEASRECVVRPSFFTKMDRNRLKSLKSTPCSNSRLCTCQPATITAPRRPCAKPPTPGRSPNAHGRDAPDAPVCAGWEKGMAHSMRQSFFPIGDRRLAHRVAGQSAPVSKMDWRIVSAGALDDKEAGPRLAKNGVLIVAGVEHVGFEPSVDHQLALFLAQLRADILHHPPSSAIFWCLFRGGVPSAIAWSSFEDIEDLICFSVDTSRQDPAASSARRSEPRRRADKVQSRCLACTPTMRNHRASVERGAGY